MDGLPFLDYENYPFNIFQDPVSRATKVDFLRNLGTAGREKLFSRNGSPIKIKSIQTGADSMFLNKLGPFSLANYYKEASSSEARSLDELKQILQSETEQCPEFRYV
jgi:hypothetical protein